MAVFVSTAGNRFPAEKGQAFSLDNFQQLLAYSHFSPPTTFTRIKKAGSSIESHSQGPKLSFPFHETEALLIKDTN